MGGCVSSPSILYLNRAELSEKFDRFNLMINPHEEAAFIKQAHRLLTGGRGPKAF